MYKLFNGSKEIALVNLYIEMYSGVYVFKLKTIWCKKRDALWYCIFLKRLACETKAVRTESTSFVLTAAILAEHVTWFEGWVT